MDPLKLAKPGFTPFSSFLCLIKNVTVKPRLSQFQGIHCIHAYTPNCLLLLLLCGIYCLLIKNCGRYWSIFLDRLLLIMRVSLSGVLLCEISIYNCFFCLSSFQSH